MTSRAVDEIDELVEVIQKALAGIVEAAKRMQTPPPAEKARAK